MDMEIVNENIQWPVAKYWDRAWNPWIGCRPVSPACEHCYARTVSSRWKMCEDFSQPRRTTNTQPPSRGIVFCGDMTDLFGEWLSAEEVRSWSAHLINTATKAYGKASYLVLTKRVERFEEFDRIFLLSKASPDNIMWGMTSENQQMYDYRITHFPMGMNGWLSAEPLLGPINLHFDDFMKGFCGLPFRWVVVGSESGSEQRECKIEWVEDIVSQCVSHGVPVFVKQLQIDGKCERDIAKFPKNLQIRQMPIGFPCLVTGRTIVM